VETEDDDGEDDQDNEHGGDFEHGWEDTKRRSCQLRESGKTLGVAPRV
jgi:hypothetical protein